MNIAEANFLYSFILPLQNTVADYIFSFISFLFNNGYFPIIVGIILLFSTKQRKTGIRILLALLIGLLIGNLVMKPFIARPRPYEFLNINLIVPLPHDFSFPSGHTQAAFAFATAVFIGNKKYGVAAFALALLVAISRLYLIVHYPTDVLGGMLLGILWGYTAEIIIKYINKKITS